MTSPGRLDDAVAAVPPQAAALLRLLSGAGDEADAALLPIPLPGARVVVLRPRDGRRLSFLLGGLASERHLLIVEDAGCAVALVRHLPRNADDDQALKSAIRAATLATRLQPDVHAGISAPLQTDVDVCSAARDAADAGRLAAERSQPWLCVDEVWADLVAQRVRDLLPQCLTSDHPLARLLAHDRHHGSAFAPTVGAWLAHQGDTIKTAQHLCLHPNTLRYRLRRARELCGIDLGDSTQMLVAQLLLDTAARPGALA
jgi:sugar diacid utilization regulator